MASRSSTRGTLLAVVRQALRATRPAIVVVSAALAFGVEGCAVANAQGAAAPQSQLAQRVLRPSYSGTPQRVLALYYPWYGTPQKSGRWIHQDGVDEAKSTIASHTNYPASGPYDSTDPQTIDRHIKQAKEAGIDTFVCSWWGRNDPTDKAIRALLDRAPAQGMKVCVYWERLSRVQDPRVALDDLSYLVGTLGKLPAYLKVDDRPVVFLYQPLCQSLAAEDWAAVINEVNKRFAPGAVVVGEGGGASDLLLWDGLHATGAVYRLTNAGAQAGVAAHPAVSAGWLHQSVEVPLLAAKRARLLSVVSVLPGFDDRKANAFAGQASGTLVERQDGKVYSALWEQAIKEAPDWILVNSFNQWHAGPEIEPSKEHGDRYLILTAEYASRFKGQAAASK